MERLKRLREYLAEALLDPINNKFYIEDLKLSIEYQENLVNNSIMHRITE